MVAALGLFPTLGLSGVDAQDEGTLPPDALAPFAGAHHLHREWLVSF